MNSQDCEKPSDHASRRLLRKTRIHNLRRTGKQWLRDATVDSTHLLLAVNNGCTGAVMRTSHTKNKGLRVMNTQALDLIADFGAAGRN